MSCTRGCQGTPICSALDLCCIQFRQDCGKGCAGVADGYSVIQIAADGSLEVCSNVGGVCTCESPATGTDTLVNNGDGTLTHTAVDAVAVDFCNGIDTILSNNDCIEGGIGDTYMLREATLVPTVAGCTQLRLESAPEHTSLCSTADAADFTVHGSPVAGTLINNVLPSNLVINNVDPCRDMACFINYTGGMLFSSHVGIGGPPQVIGPDQIEFNPVFTVNGAPTFNPFARNASVDTHFYGIDVRTDYATQGWSGCHTIVPGGNLTLASSFDLSVILNATILNIVSEGGSISVFCSTV